MLTNAPRKAHPGDVKAQPGIVEAQPGVVKAQPGEEEELRCVENISSCALQKAENMNFLKHGKPLIFKKNPK
jgi:hypothetical protein